MRNLELRLWTYPLTDPHSAPTRVIALENTLNGTVFPQEEIIQITEFARRESIKVHLDGARLWHVSAETGTPMKELCDPFDSVSLCFSKGLGRCDGHLEGHIVHGFLQEPLLDPVSLETRISSLEHGGIANSLGAACARLECSPVVQLMLSITTSLNCPVCIRLRAGWKRDWQSLAFTS